jgi:hypothetical protein
MRSLMQVPAIRDALHAQGPEADELRGFMDWLLLTGVVLGIDGDDGLDDVAGDSVNEIYSGHGDDELADHIAAPANGVMLGGPSGGAFQPPTAVNGFVFGTTSYVKQPTSDGFLYGQTVYLAGDSQDHNPDIADD